MQNFFYQKYIKEYKNGLELLQKKKRLHQYREGLEEDRKQNFIRLKRLITDLTVVKARQAELATIEETIKVKSSQIERTHKEIEINAQKCHDKQTSITNRVQMIERFKKEFVNEFKQSEEK